MVKPSGNSGNRFLQADRTNVGTQFMAKGLGDVAGVLFFVYVLRSVGISVPASEIGGASDQGFARTRVALSVAVAAE
jgi:hypothetical protein